MQMKLFAFKDAKAEAYGLPFGKPTPGEAERAFIQARRDKQTTIYQFPEDYDLYELGSYDTSSGKVSAHDTPRHIIKASDIPAE